MELYQHFLAQEPRLIKKDLMVFKIVYVFDEEGRHAYFPDHLPGSSPELYIMGSDDGIGLESGSFFPEQ